MKYAIHEETQEKNTFSEIILSLFFPPVCGFCNEINSQYLCDNCRRKFDAIKTSQIENYEKDPVYFDEHFYMFKYEKDIREYILKYKFNEKSYMYKSFAKLMCEDKVFMQELSSKIDVIVSVPVHKKRFKVRGYNQSSLIAKEIAKLLKIDYHENVLIKDKNIVAQSSLEKLDRVRNIKDAFALGKNADLIKEKNVLLIDDVFTTGATVNECCRLLKKQGASYVIVATIAKS